MSSNDSRARAEIVRYGRLLWDRRLVAGSSGNLSVRLDDGDLLVTPSGISLREMADAQIVRVDPAGAPRDPRQHPTTELPLHIAAYKARPDASCVVHTHPTFCVVWSKVGSIFPRDTVGARETLGPVAWTAYRDPGTRELADLCAAEFARGFDTVVMERHGVSTVAQTLERAFVLTDLAEEAARIAYFSRLADLTD